MRLMTVTAIILTTLIAACGKDKNSEKNTDSETEGSFNKEKVPVKIFDIAEITNVNLLENQSISLTKQTKSSENQDLKLAQQSEDPPYSTVCTLEKKRLDAQKYLDSFQVYDEKCGVDLSTGIRYKFANGEKYLAEKISDKRVRVTHCLNSGSLYYFVDVEKTGENVGKFKLKGGDVVYDIDKYSTDENTLSAKLSRRSEQNDGLVGTSLYTAVLKKDGISTVTESEYTTRPKADGPDEEYSARKIMKLNQAIGMYFHWITDTEQVAPYDDIEKTIYVNAETYATIENSGEPEFIDSGVLYVNKDSLPASSKGLQLEDVSGIWNCEGFDEEIAECSESGSGTPNPSDTDENSAGSGKHPCDTN